MENIDTAAPEVPDPAAIGQEHADENPPDFNLPVGGELEFTLDETSRARLGEEVVNDYLWTLKRNQSVYAWQDFSTKFIFSAVLLLVFTGVTFSGVQFFKGARRKTSEGESQEVSHVELSVKGIKVSSPFLGVVILVISLAFFYLYLVYVYPISLTH